MHNMTLVLHFNAFSGQLVGGYLMHTISKAKAGKTLSPADVLATLSANPTMRCSPLAI